MKKSACCLLFALGLPVVAAAQPSARPTDPSAPAAAPDYRSAFAGYRSYAEHPLRSWQEVNDEVRRIGGHAGYVRSTEGGRDRRETAQPSAAQQQPERKPLPAEPADRHHGH